MKNRYWIACSVIVLATVAFTLALYSKLPATIPTHWDAAGNVNGYGPRSFVFIETVLMLMLMVLWPALPSLSPKRFTVDSFDATYWHIGVIAVALLGYLQCVIVWGAYSPSMPINRALFGGLAMFLGLVGNVMGKVRRNFWIGIRTPWTLANERVWYSTHRLAAKTMLGGAVLSLAGMFAGLPLGLCLAVLLAGPILPAVYSLIFYKRLERSGHLEA